MGKDFLKNKLSFQQKTLPLQPLLRPKPNLVDYGFEGEMVEWSITTVLKTVVPRGTGGSNPSLSATESCKSKDLRDFCFLFLFVVLPLGNG